MNTLYRKIGCQDDSTKFLWSNRLVWPNCCPNWLYFSTKPVHGTLNYPIKKKKITDQKLKFNGKGSANEGPSWKSRLIYRISL